MRAWSLILGGLTVLALALPAWSAVPQPPTGHPRPATPPPHSAPARPAPPMQWRDLNSHDKRMLAPLKSHWNRMPPRVQHNVVRKARHWEHLPPRQRDAIRQHIRQWQHMSPAQRAQARANHRVYRKLTPTERARLHAAYQRFHKMPPAKQKQLRAQWHRLTPAQRKQWIKQGATGNLPQPDSNGHPLH